MSEPSKNPSGNPNPEHPSETVQAHNFPQEQSVPQERQNPYASANRWRHQESAAFADYAATHTSDTQSLANFLNRDRVEPPAGRDGAGPAHQPIIVANDIASPGLSPQPPPPDHQQGGGGSGGGGGLSGAPISDITARLQQNAHRAQGEVDSVLCGPLLNYRHMEEGFWIGSVLIVTAGGGAHTASNVASIPVLQLQPDRTGSSSEHQTSSAALTETYACCLYSDHRVTFWQFPVSVPINQEETRWKYQIAGARHTAHPDREIGFRHFSVPAASESMRLLFFSCNGFSVGTDEDAWSGPALWHDVLRFHSKKPFHVMIGGGDQIYNDGIRVDGPLQSWTGIRNPQARKETAFDEKLRAACDDYYLANYLRWYSTEPFATANGQIPQVSIWDDHDIIDGFGSYVDSFMRCSVFRGIGGSAHKYYLLFQHHLPPPKVTFTTDNPSCLEADSPQLANVYVAPGQTDPSHIIGSKPGPYVEEHSLNIFTRLGARMALLGLDARTERTRHQVNYPETYEAIFARTRSELSRAKEGGQPIQHLILLLGIPIAYPRLTWLENIFRSPVMGPVKFLNRRFGVGGGFFNYFDGSIDLLDDLDDHYTAKTHKAERRKLVESLQAIAAEFSVRVTILGGDVHLAALGRFYSKPHLDIPPEQDHRFMVNVVSSAIVNKPPPVAVANLLAHRNKIHHLNSDTDETMLELFDRDPGNSNKTSKSNHCTMPSRNFAVITENSPFNVQTIPVTATPEGANGDSTKKDSKNAEVASGTIAKNGRGPLHEGELHAGTKHVAATEAHGTRNDGSLDVMIRVEIDQHDREGRTEAYGLTVPLLHYAGALPPPTATSAQPSSRQTTSRPNTGHRTA